VDFFGICTNFHSADFRIKRKTKDFFQTNISSSMLIRVHSVKVKQTGRKILSLLCDVITWHGNIYSYGDFCVINVVFFDAYAY